MTSRNRLTGLITGHGARLLPIDVLPGTEAHALLSTRLGADRIVAEPAATDELLAYCGGIPLALSIVAGRVQTSPHSSLAAVAADLREARLAALDDDDPAVSLPTVLSWSYAALTPEQTRVLGLLGIAPGPDISLRAAANLAGLPGTRTRALLRGLAQVSLIDEDTSGRYRMHDLVRHYAADRAASDQIRADREAALRRLAAFYLHTANAGDQLLPPSRPPIELGLPAPEEPHPLADEAAVVAWFAAEHSCVLATQQLAATQGWHPVVWQLAWALHNFHRRGYRREDVVVWQAGVTAADHLDDLAVQARAHGNLGRALNRTGRPTEAIDHLQRAITFAEQADDLYGQADAHHSIGNSWVRHGDFERALEHATHALRLFRRLDSPLWEARALNSVGWCHANLGQYDEARAHCEAALSQLSRLRPGVAANTLDSLGYIAHHTGEQTQAIDYYQQALGLIRGLGDAYSEADTLQGLGHPLAALGRHDEARATWQQAVELFQAQHRAADADRVRQLVDQLDA